MIDRKRSYCKHVATHYVGSAGAQRMERVFSEGKGAKRWEAPNVTGLLAAMDLENVQKVMSPFT
jgi:hypothetical protein